jgi:hypothetical protein
MRFLDVPSADVLFNHLHRFVLGNYLRMELSVAPDPPKCRVLAKGVGE